MGRLLTKDAVRVLTRRMRNLLSATGACIVLLLVLLFLRKQTHGSHAPNPAARQVSSSALTGDQRVCRSYLDTIHGDRKAWVSWTSRGDEVTVQINSGYFQVSSERLQNVDEALRWAAAPDANDIAVVKYEDQSTRE